MRSDLDRAEEKRIARLAYLQSVELGYADFDEAFFFRGFDRAKVRIIRRRIPSATQVAEAA